MQQELKAFPLVLRELLDAQENDGGPCAWGTSGSFSVLDPDKFVSEVSSSVAFRTYQVQKTSAFDLQTQTSVVSAIEQFLSFFSTIYTSMIPGPT
jgi:hypothetical protein